jgi:hypothetical protein
VILSTNLWPVLQKISIVNDTSKVIRKTIISNTPNCGITYDCHSDDSRGVIHAPKEHFIVQALLMMIVIYDHHIFIVQATEFGFIGLSHRYLFINQDVSLRTSLMKDNAQYS